MIPSHDPIPLDTSWEYYSTRLTFDPDRRLLPRDVHPSFSAVGCSGCTCTLVRENTEKKLPGSPVRTSAEVSGKYDVHER